MGACADGAAYDPAADRWRPLTLDASVTARANHVAVWTGQAMVVWGGIGGGAEALLKSGLRFTPRD